MSSCTCRLRGDPWKAPEQHATTCPERTRSDEFVGIMDPGHPLLCAMRIAAWRVEEELRKARDRIKDPTLVTGHITARNLARSRVNRRVEYLEGRPAMYLGDRDYSDSMTGRAYEHDALLVAWGR